MNIKMRAMPSSVDANLEDIKGSLKNIIEESGGKGVQFSEEPVAFGLKAIMIMFICPEDQEVEEMENKLRDVENINSIEVVDMRRAI